LGKYFAEELINKYSDSFFGKYDFIIPVPLHPVKLRERGYNQSFEIIKHLPGKSDKIISRKKKTVSQTKLTREERIQNVTGAFECVKDIQSSVVLLFDDIITTGSTINECAGQLLKCGARKVDILCLAAPLKHAV
jgi:ComF family protein